MSFRALVKCSSLIFLVFLMCPKRFRTSAVISKDQEYYHNARKSDVVSDAHNTVKLLGKPFDIFWSKDWLSGVDEEPGFQITEEEFKKFKLWPKGIVPYYIDVVSFNDKVLRDRIRSFLNVASSVTKITFLEMPSPPTDFDTRWVFFVNRRGQLGCGDHSILNFTNHGVQRVVLGYDCMSTTGELAEAMLAIAGVPPQHNAPDRDEYIQINEENIVPEKRYLFRKLNDDEWLFYDIKYDFASAGHFHYHKHSINGRATIETLKPYTGISIGESKGLSNSDIIKLRMLYNHIAKQKEDKVSDCDKLFKKGHNFNGQKLSLELKKPRRKPNKYLGLPDDEPVTHDKENKEVDKEVETNAMHYSDDKDKDLVEEESFLTVSKPAETGTERPNENMNLKHMVTHKGRGPHHHHHKRITPI